MLKEKYEVGDRYGDGRVIAVYPHYITVKTKSGYNECYEVYRSQSKLDELLDMLMQAEKDRGRKWELSSKPKQWESHEEHNLLYLRNEQKFSYKQLSKVFNKSQSAIRAKLYRLKCK